MIYENMFIPLSLERLPPGKGELKANLCHLWRPQADGQVS
jgi:hypothetical protein